MTTAFWGGASDSKGKDEIQGFFASLRMTTALVRGEALEFRGAVAMMAVGLSLMGITYAAVVTVVGLLAVRETRDENLAG
jgi:hypothetical protein